MRPMKTINYLLSVVILSFLSACSNEREDSLIESVIRQHEKLQEHNLSQFERGQYFRAGIVEEWNTIPKDEVRKLRYERVSKAINFINSVDKETDKLIKKIDHLKTRLLQKSGIFVSTSKEKNPKRLIWLVNYEGLCIPPNEYNLLVARNKNDFNVSGDLFCSSNKFKPALTGIVLDKAIVDYRNNLILLAHNYLEKDILRLGDLKSGKLFSKEELIKKAQQIIKSCFTNSPEDIAVMEEVYVELTEVQLSNKESHWIDRLFRNSSLVSAITSLTSLQNSILSVRATILGHWSSKFGSCSYGFDRILPIAKGPSVVKLGEEVNLQVLMSAFDSYNNPLVTTELEKAEILSSKEGIGCVKFKAAKKGLQTIRGTVTIKNKSGVAKTEKWEWTIQVIE